MHHYIHSIKVASNVGLWVSLGVSLTTILFFFVGNYRFYATNEVFKMGLIVGTLLVLVTAMLILVAVRKSLPQMRALSEVEEKFRQYCGHIQRVYYGSMAVILVECAITLFTYNRNLIMFIIILMLMLFMSFPNIYRIKVDLALTDQQMKDIFGDEYIADPVEQDVDSAELLEETEELHSGDNVSKTER